MSRRVIPAAVQGPSIGAELPPYQSRRLTITFYTPQRYIGLSRAEITNKLARIQLDLDLRMPIVKLTEERDEQRDGIDFFGGDLHRPTEVARLRRSRFDKTLRSAPDIAGSFKQAMSQWGEHVTRLPLLEEREAKPSLERSDPSGDSGLADF